MQQVDGRVVVIGGANLDIVGHSFKPLVSRDSNPGFVRRSAGGVGRNAAENLARLGIETALVTAFGNDSAAHEVSERCEAVGVDLSGSIRVELPGSLYLAILDEGGEMALALSDMRALDRLTPQVLEERRELIDGAQLLVCDANLPAETLGWIASEARPPILFDPVSTGKAVRAAPIVGRLSAIKCNSAEAAMLLSNGSRVTDDPARLARRLVATGMLAAYVTSGAGGVHYADDVGSGHLPAPRTTLADATGAGDAFTAGVAAAMLAGVSARHAADFGTKLAGLTLASEHTVSDHVDETLLALEMETWG